MNIDRIDAWTENVLDKLERASKPLAIVCCLIVAYFIGRAIVCCLIVAYFIGRALLG